VPPSRDEWAVAFATQARSDWAVFGLLCELAVPQPDHTGEGEPSIPAAVVEWCHALHYLQMACEKVAKAYRLRDTAADPDELMGGHVGFPRFIRAFCKAPQVKAVYDGRASHLRSLEKSAFQLAQKVEKLAPAADRAARPDNAEYPWAVGDLVVVPAHYAYPNLSLLRQPGGRAFLKIVGRAMSGFEEIRIY